MQFNLQSHSLLVTVKDHLLTTKIVNDYQEIDKSKYKHKKKKKKYIENLDMFNHPILGPNVYFIEEYNRRREVKIRKRTLLFIFGR